MPSPNPTLYLDPVTHDIYVTPLGVARLTEDVAEETMQRLDCKLRMFLGEWFLNKLEGIPYHRDVLIKNPNLPAIRTMFAKVLQDDEGVESIQSLQLSIDSATRNLAVLAEVQLVSGDVLPLTVGPFVL